MHKEKLNTKKHDGIRNYNSAHGEIIASRECMRESEREKWRWKKLNCKFVCISCTYCGKRERCGDKIITTKKIFHMYMWETRLWKKSITIVPIATEPVILNNNNEREEKISKQENDARNICILYISICIYILLVHIICCSFLAFAHFLSNRHHR